MVKWGNELCSLLLEQFKLGMLVNEVNVKAGISHSHQVFSVTKHNGFVPAGEYFNKKIHSDDTSGYKVVKKGRLRTQQFILTRAPSAILTMQRRPSSVQCTRCLSWNRIRGFCQNFFYQILKSDNVLSRFRDGNGSIKRRKSVSFSSFELHQVLQLHPRERTEVSRRETVDMLAEQDYKQNHYTPLYWKP